MCDLALPPAPVLRVHAPLPRTARCCPVRLLATTPKSVVFTQLVPLFSLGALLSSIYQAYLVDDAPNDRELKATPELLSQVASVQMKHALSLRLARAHIDALAE